MYAGLDTRPIAVTTFWQGLRSIQSGAPKLPVRKYDFDWHFMFREMRDVGTVEAVWQKLESLLPESGLACGVMEDADAGRAAAESQPAAGTFAITSRRVQRRLPCASCLAVPCPCTKGPGRNADRMLTQAV